MEQTILVAGATGNLGERIVKALLKKGAAVRILTRPESDPQKVMMLQELGASLVQISHWNTEELTTACEGVSCVVSVLAGLRDVILDAQKILLDAAVLVGVPRFIPSDYSLDFTRFSEGENRNLDLRREFHSYLDASPIQATSIFNGAFMDMLTNEMPLIFFKRKLILYWGKADFRWGFTTMDNTASYTACVAMDESTPRYLRIAGDRISPREVKNVMSEITGEPHSSIRPGGKRLLGLLIKIARFMAPGKKELYPAWQGMQYMHNMIDERSTIDQLDNDRYKGIKWTTVKQLLSSHLEH